MSASTENKPYPPVPRALLEHLESAYGPLMPEDSWSERKLWTEVGIRRLIRTLRVVHDRQTASKIPADYSD